MNLKNLLQTPDYAELSDADAAELIVEPRHEMANHELHTERGVVEGFTDPLAGDTLLQKLEAVAESESPMASLVKRTLGWLEPSNDGIDFSLPSVLAQLDALVFAGAITQSEANTLKGLGVRLVSDAQRYGLGQVGIEQIKRARMIDG